MQELFTINTLRNAFRFKWCRARKIKSINQLQPVSVSSCYDLQGLVKRHTQSSQFIRSSQYLKSVFLHCHGAASCHQVLFQPLESNYTETCDILQIDQFQFQLMHHNFTLLTKSLYMFRAPTCPSSGGQTIYTTQLVKCYLKLSV